LDSGGGGVGFGTPVVAWSVVFIDTTVSITVSVGFGLEVKNPGPTIKMTISSKCMLAVAIRHFFCSRFMENYFFGVGSVRSE